ncbi:MAG: PmoA family protein [Flavobacteriales bacterium]|nr:PmoA family protein [Flavobacteriales bacterium]
MSTSQEIAKFTISSGNVERINTTVCVPLQSVNYNTDNGNIVLYEITKNSEIEIPCQIEPGHSANLWFILSGISQKSENRDFVIRIQEKQKSISGITLKKDEKDLSITYNEKPILNYRFGITYPPAGIDPLFKRSGFIHPLWSPGGEVLSRIQAPDHYHHYGIWGPWTVTHIGEREVDFWNLLKGQGTVKFNSFLSEYEGSVYTGFQAIQNHIDFGASGEDQIAIKELLDVRAWNISSEGKIWMVDYTTNINSPLEKGIMLDAYRYGGGIGFRATEKWHKDNCTVLTSEGKERVDADGTFARWCIVEGESDTEEGRSGILFLSHPSNRMHPEPMRVWPLDGNSGRGDMYFEFVPIRHEDWKLETKKNYTLKYRMIVFDGELDVKTAEMYWAGFASLPVVQFK